MGKPLILKGFWNVRRLKKYRQKKLKISGNVVKKYYVNHMGKYKMQSVKTTEKARITFRVFLLFLQNSISFSE